MNADNIDWIGKTIGEVLKQCKYSPKDIRYIDEPPGKLHAVEIWYELNGNKQRIVLEIKYHIKLFSASRNWPIDLIRKQKVVAVHNSSDFLL